MAQLPKALAQLFAGPSPAEALNQLNAFCVHMLPRHYLTSAIGTGIVRHAFIGQTSWSSP
jgi:hypothetical protein